MSDVQTEMVILYFSVEAANAVKAVGQIVIKAKWNKTDNTEAKTRAIVLNMESLGVSEVPESFRALVKAALETAAETQLKEFVNSTPNATEIPAEYFTRPALIESFLGQNLWLDQSRADVLFTASFTWQSRVKSEKWNNPQYQKLAEKVKADYLSLCGKKTRLAKDKAETLIAIIDERDLDGEWGIFATRRLTQMINRADQEIDYSAF